MATATVLERISVEDYLALEKEADVRHEYLNGELVAVAGGSRIHNLLATRVARLLGDYLEGSSGRIYHADRKVRIQPTNRFYYPDVMVCCDPLGQEPDEGYETAPCLIVEVLALRTADTDDGEKRINYQTLASLQEYLLLHPTERTAVLYRRSGESWIRYALNRDDTLELVSVGCRIELDRLFA